MSARCFKDNCGLSWDETLDELGGPAYEGTVRRDASLRCDLTTGIGVDLVEDASTLVTSVQGTPLLVQLPVAEVEHHYENADNASGDPQVNNQVQDAVTSSGTFQNSPYPHSWTNDTGRAAIVLVSGTFNLEYAILGPASAENTADLIRVGGVNFPGLAGDTNPLSVVPYNAQWHARLRFGINDGATPSTSVQVKFPTSGMISTFLGAGVYQKQAIRVPFADTFRVEAGEVLSIRGDIAHAGPDQTVNVVARGSGALAGLGFGLRDLKFAIMPTR